MCLQQSDCLFYFCSENGCISIFILRQCSEDVVICVQFVVVEFFIVLGPSPKYCPFSVRRVPFFLRCLTIRLNFFCLGLSTWNKPVWCCFPSSQSLFQCTVYISSRSFLILFLMSLFSSWYCLCASSLVVLFFFSFHL